MDGLRYLVMSFTAIIRAAMMMMMIIIIILTPWSGVLLEKLTGSQIVKKIPAFYGTRRLITAFTSARHLS